MAAGNDAHLNQAALGGNVSESKNLAEALPIEIARVRELLGEYKALPHHVGYFGATMLEAVLRRADHAMADGDVVRMIGVYQELKDCE